MSTEIYAKHIGEKYGRLEVIGVIRNGKPRFQCLCQCGNEKEIEVFSIFHGKTLSCGCLRKEKSASMGKSNAKPAVHAGELFENKLGLTFEIKEYVRSSKVLVRFVESGYETYSAVKEIKKGSIRDWIATPLKPPSNKKYSYYVKKEKVPIVLPGQRMQMNCGHEVEVVNYVNSAKVVAKWLSPKPYEFEASMQSLRTGKVKNLYHPSVHGFGWIGVGEYNPADHPKAREKFSNMIGRCYLERELIKCPTYRECTVVDEWLDFQNFASWYFDQKGCYEDGWTLDKDILVKGNKIYKPEVCCLVPQEINKLFTKREAKRGELCIGVSEFSPGVYRAGLSNKILSGKKWQGKLRSSEAEAFLDYKKKKEEIIKEVAQMYKGVIDTKVYDALMKYEVDIND